MTDIGSDLLTNDVIASCRSRQVRAITLGDDDQTLWDALARAADLHRPLAENRFGQTRCAECTSAEVGRVWPCQTLRLIAMGLGLSNAAPA